MGVPSPRLDVGQLGREMRSSCSYDGVVPRLVPAVVVADSN
jgi:hypothetical protein